MLLRRFTPRFTALLLLLLGTSSATGAVYRCEETDQPVLYSQFQCPPQHQQRTITAEPQNLIDIPELSGAEAAALNSLEKNLADDRARAQRARTQARAQQAARIARNKALCDAARQDMATLQARKRKGYSAAEARKLAELGRELRRLRKANC